MSVFFEHDDDPGFEPGQRIAYGGRSWYIAGVRANSRGVWLSLEGAP